MKASRQNITERRSLTYNPALDGLRGLAILLVLLHHFRMEHNPDSFGSAVYLNLKSLGWVGVDLFFVLSGFLIGSILLKSYGGKDWIRNFIVRRAVRVLPLYFLVIFACFNVITLISIPDLNWLRELSEDQWWYWLHLANFRKLLSVYAPSVPTVGWFSTYWSLSIEEHFYLAWPFVLMAAGPKRIGKVSAFGILAVVAVRTCIAVSDLSYSFIYNNTFTRLDGLMLGSLLGWANEFHRDRLVRLGRPVAVIFGISILTFLVPMFFGYTGGGRNTLYGKLVLYSASVAGSGAVVWYLITQPSKSLGYRWMSSKLLISLGTYSYAIYVFNKPIMYAVDAVCNPIFGQTSTLMSVAIWLIACLICWFTGWVSWQLIESPCLKLKKFFPSPRTGREIDNIREQVQQRRPASAL